jgi:hypothetical protein
MKVTSKVLLCLVVLLVVAAFADAEVFRTLCTRAHPHSHICTHTNILFDHLKNNSGAPCGLAHFSAGTTGASAGASGRLAPVLQSLLQCTREARLLTLRLFPQDETPPKRRLFGWLRTKPTEDRPDGSFNWVGLIAASTCPCITHAHQHSSLRSGALSHMPRVR